jgi:hypothetical protein
VSRRTDLCDIVQNSDEGVTILEPGCHASFSTNSHRRTTYFLNSWSLCHLYLIASAVVRVIRKGFCCSTDVFDPKESALCSESPDEDALIRSRGLLSIQQRKNQCTPSKSSLGNELGRNDYCDKLRVPDCCSKQNSPHRYWAYCSEKPQPPYYCPRTQQQPMK